MDILLEEWQPTIHHRNSKLVELAQDFLDLSDNKLGLFYIWGHSYEFDDDNNWEMFENFCQLISNRKAIWYATNKEIVDYLSAFDNLKFTDEFSEVYNPSLIAVWISVNGQPIEIKPGEVKKLTVYIFKRCCVC